MNRVQYLRKWLIYLEGEFAMEMMTPCEEAYYEEVRMLLIQLLDALEKKVNGWCKPEECKVFPCAKWSEEDVQLWHQIHEGGK